MNAISNLRKMFVYLSAELCELLTRKLLYLARKLPAANFVKVFSPTPRCDHENLEDCLLHRGCTAVVRQICLESIERGSGDLDAESKKQFVGMSVYAIIPASDHLR